MSILARVMNALMAVIIPLTGLLFTGQRPAEKMPSPAAGEFTQYVNPFVGTGAVPWSGGMTNPGATAPFGTVRLAPDTCLPFGLNIHNVGTGGYYYYKTYTYGFSHLRVSGAGLIDGGRFRVTPGLGNDDPLKRLTRPLLFGHENETAQPGYYAVWLPEVACLAELTATVHTGVHRYTFSSAKDAHLFLDATSLLGDKNENDLGRVKVVDDHTLEGEFRGQNYFYAVFDTPFAATPWLDGEMLPGQTEAKGNDAGVDLNFGDRKDKPVTLWLGFSYISVAEAANNLNEESKNVAFDTVFASTRDDWDERLASIEIKSGNDEIKRIFYTAMYHSMIHPTNMTEVSGKYRGFGGVVGTAEGFTYRNDLSLWDTFRTTHSLYCLVAPDIERDSVQSLLRMAEAHGGFPRWPRGDGDGGSMFGNPAHMVIAETYLKGQMTQADAEASLDFMKQTVLRSIPEGKPYRGRDYGDEYRTLGYVPGELDKISVSRTLEYAWADYSAYLMADALGREADAAMFQKLSKSYQNLFDPETKYFRAKDSAGNWQDFCPWITTYYDEILPKKLARGYSEGSARHYRWHAIQDPQWLITNMGGSDYFVKELDTFMKDASRQRAGIDPGSGWWVGNQHNYHAPYMFNEAGRPDLTQKWVRWTLTERYADATNGLDGNDDLGALSAWYIFSAMGFFPVAGTDRYWLGSPIVDEATLQLGGGKTLTIKALNQSAKNMYVTSVKLNGAPLDGISFTHDQIKDGGTLEFVMSAKP